MSGNVPQRTVAHALTTAQVAWIGRNPASAWEACAAADAEDSLMGFARMMWPIIEPARRLVEGWALHAIADHLEAVTCGHIRKLLINVPPGFMKSLLTSVLWPAWEWGPKNRPWSRYVCASYSEALTTRDNVKARFLMKSDLYRRNWGDRFAFSLDQDAKKKFANDRTGFKVATSVRGLGTGERGDRVIVDDPHNVLQGESDKKRNEARTWFTEVMPSRTNDAATAAFVVIMQRVHEQDVSGLILAEDLGYEHLCIPMHYDPNHPFASKAVSTIGYVDPRKVDGELAFPERFAEREIADMLKVMRSEGGTYAEAGQLEQRPEPRGGGMFQLDWFEVVDAIPEHEHVQRRVRGWDFAGTKNEHSDYTAGVKLAETQAFLYVEDVVWEQVSPHELDLLLLKVCAADGWSCFQSFPKDPAQAGIYQAAAIAKLLQGYDFETTPEQLKKEERVKPFRAQCEARRVKLVRGAWNRGYLVELSKFPNGKLKDRVDASSRAYGALLTREPDIVPAGPVLIEGAPPRKPDERERPEDGMDEDEMAQLLYEQETPWG